ncbi:MAG: hypothetical protein C5B50_18585 [Verrucomicrobia bacterium]|nr:MAG: hypothetical protein C5B50_18585 [Verrucomicrobiota bacterium]
MPISNCQLNSTVAVVFANNRIGEMQKRQRTGALQDALRIFKPASIWRSFWTALPMDRERFHFGRVFPKTPFQLAIANWLLAIYRPTVRLLNLNLSLNLKPFPRRNLSPCNPWNACNPCNSFNPVNLFNFFTLLVLLLTPFSTSAVLPNIWHLPDNSSDLGLNMRAPEFEIGTNTTITIYQGLQKFNNGFGTANQTGGTLYYKGLSQFSWSATNLTFYLNGGPSPNNQYWQASFNSASVGAEEVIQYYIYATFDGVNGVQNAYLYGGDNITKTTATQSVAATSPYTIRNRPAWLFHNGNRVITQGSDSSHDNVAFWIKMGYLGKDSSVSSRWADNGAVYYTTDGSNPAGALGFPSNTTQVAVMGYDHEEGDASIAGNAMWWTGTVSNLPLFSSVKYKIGVWNSSNSEEKFADYDAGSNNATFTFALGSPGDPVLTVNGVSADYTTTHVFVDEVAGDSVPLTMLFTPNAANLTATEVFSNLNRRDRATQDANGDGIEDGIIAPDGNAIVAGDDSNYYKAYTMSNTATAGQYALTLYAQKTGAYRLTARYKVSGNTNWFWYSSNGRRDHAIVVTPKKARNIILYELNAMNIGSQGTQDYQRSTFADLYNGPNSRPYDPVTNRFNLAYVQNLGVNWLWFQPIHPIGVQNRQTDPNTGQPYSVGSPYSVKNFFQVNPLLSKANTRDAGMMEFTNFVAAADAAGINVMLDGTFNHTSWDCELDGSGVYYFAPSGNPGNWQATEVISGREARVYSASGQYCGRASSSANCAVAPDRGDFGKWSDVSDIFFGRYAALVCTNPNDNGNYVNEGDWLDTTVATGNFDAITRNVWRYFSDYALYWLDKTGCPSGTPASQTYHGIDGLRADFGQGLPPQCWEYIINKVRTRKWDFVFMSESLDGGNVTYRSNRHFDMLNENLVFGLESAASTTDYRNLFEARRSSYGQSLVLLNHTSHDEQSYSDPYQALIRHAVCSSIDGAPMIFYGEELGISTSFGFDLYELNFGKNIPHFKTYNSMQPIFSPGNRNFGLDQLWPVYAAINQARGFSAALKSSNRYFLNLTSGSAQANIFSVAKYERANGSPNFSDVVFAFATLDRNNTQSGFFNVNIVQNGSNLFGIKSGRTYNVRNIAAYTAADSNRRNYWLWGNSGTSGDSLLNNGLFVSLNPVPSTNTGWTNAPFEAQYLKLYDVTPPPAPVAPSTPKPYALSNSVTFTWPAVSDPDGGVSDYHVLIGTSPGGSNIFDGLVNATSLKVTGVFGQTLYAQVSVINNAGIEGAFSSASPGTLLLDPATIIVGTLRTNETLSVTWPGNFGSWAVLYNASNIAPPVVWSPAPGTAVQTNQQWRLPVSPTNNARFYRLQLN